MIFCLMFLVFLSKGISVTTCLLQQRRKVYKADFSIESMAISKIFVEGLGEYATSTGNLVANARELGGRLASMRTDALARLVTAGDGKANIGKSEGARVGLEFNYVKGGNPVVVKYDRLSVPFAQRTVDANSRNQYLCTNSTRRYEQHAKQAEREEKSGVPYEQRTALMLVRDNFNMSPNENLNQFAFFLEDLAVKEGEKSYFVLNGRNPIIVSLIDKDIVDGKRDSQFLQNPSGTIVVPYGWFRSLGDRSELDGCSRGASYCGNRARGVFEASTLQGAKPTQKIVAESYSPAKIERALRHFRIGGLSREFLQYLRNRKN